MHRLKLSARAALAAALLLSACGRGGGGGGDEIVIGVAGPLSLPNGRSMWLAAEMAAAEINASGGIGGRKVRLELADDSASQARAIEVATRLRANPEVVAVVGHVNSSATAKAAVIYNMPVNDSVAGTPVVQISPASSSPQITQAGEWTFRVCPTDLEFSPVLADWAVGLGTRRAAVVYANDDYGQGVAATFRDAFRGKGGEVVSADPYLPAVYDRAETLDPYLQRALSRRVDALVIGGQAAEGLKIVSAARRLGFTGPILGADGLTGVKDGGPVAEGVFVSSAFLPDRPDTTAQRFVAAYRQAHNELPDHRGAMTYDVLMLLKRAIEEVGTDRQAIRDYLARVGAEGGHAAFPGVSGTIRFDENGDAVKKDIAVGVVRGGRLVTARR